LPRVNYFQVVFNLPDTLSSLIIGNSKELYKLLFQSSWNSLDAELRRSGKFHPAALMVLHT
ncbi:MAG: IS91 family transposase, partial [Planctomycetota bacterium]